MKRWTKEKTVGDEGAVLILALVFLLLFALFIPVLLGSTTTNISISGTLDQQRRQVYAAEAGLRARVETLRADNTAAVYGSTCGPSTPSTFNSLPVRVQCTPQPSSGETALTRPPYALLALPSLNSGTEGVSDSPTNGSGGGGATIYVGGKVASNGVIERVGASNSGAFVISGAAVGHSCIQKRVGDIQYQDGTPNCTVVATTFADPGVGNNKYDLESGFPGATNPSVVCLANAAKFVPGYYTTTPSSPCGSKAWWFSPGLYYFDFTTSGEHVMDLSGRTVVAGTPNLANYDPNTLGVGPANGGSCKTDDNTPPNTGTTWVFGADTHLDVGTGSVELCPTVSYTKQELSIVGYGASGATSAGVTTATESPTTNTQSPLNGFTNPANSYAIDGSESIGVVPSNSTRTITLGTYLPALSASASIEKVMLRVKHRETVIPVATLTATVTYPGSTSTTMASGCSTGQLCASTTSREDDLDITHDYMVAAASGTPSLTVTFSIKSVNGAPTTEALDGVVLDLTYAPAGDFRRQSGCTVLPVTDLAASCDTVTNSSSANLHVQGTVYAPLGRVNVTGSGSSVDFNRGVIARDIVGSIHPGNGSANLFGVGHPERLALLTAEVQIDGVWRPTLESLVRFDDNLISTPARGPVTYLSWRVIR